VREGRGPCESRSRAFLRVSLVKKEIGATDERLHLAEYLLLILLLLHLAGRGNIFLRPVGEAGVLEEIERRDQVSNVRGERWNPKRVTLRTTPAAGSWNAREPTSPLS